MEPEENCWKIHGHKTVYEIWQWVIIVRDQREGHVNTVLPFLVQVREPRMLRVENMAMQSIGEALTQNEAKEKILGDAPGKRYAGR